MWPLLFGLLVYLAIDSNTPFAHENHGRQVAGYVLVGAATLLSIAAFTGRRFENAQPILAWTIALFLSIAASTWGAPDFRWSIERLYLYYAVVLFGVGLYLTHRGDSGRTVAHYFAVVPAVHMIFLVEALFYLVWIQSEPGAVFRRLPHFANIRHFAYHGFIAAACASSLFTMSRKLESTAFVLTAAALFGIVLLGARGALLAWIVFAAFVLVFHHRRLRFLAFCALALAVAAGAVHYLTEAGLLQGVTSLFRRFETEEGGGFRIGDRIMLWADTLRTIAERPWLGFGPEGFLGSRCCNSRVAQPHNFVLQFVLEFGLIGSGLMIFTAWAMVRACGGLALIRANLSSDSGLLSLCAVLFGFMTYAMIDGLLYHAIPLTHFALFAALLFATMVRLAAGQAAVGVRLINRDR
ncbi:MAG: O-antigen ligase family protein [Burkholderiaceae bacterium]|nr:O-antigen ligase family protein [Burkholderiaceae bacterium]